MNRKKLIEVALPLEAINAASAKEKSIRHGHPSTLHLWWARRPLAACRAVLFASLVDDPSSDPMFGGDEDIEASKRAELFNLIEELVLWENSNNSRVINRARAEIARCIASRKIETGELKKEQKLPGNTNGQEIKQMLASSDAVNAFLAKHAPPVIDPFCGGGSIPLEAQRLGLVAHGTDLNPVPVIVTKTLIEIPSQFADASPVNPDSRTRLSTATYTGIAGLAEDICYYGKLLSEEAFKRVGNLYPKVRITPEMVRTRPDLKLYLGQQLTVIAWLWAKTVPSPNPAAHEVHVPLVKSFWLNKNRGKEVWIEPVVDQRTNSYTFRVRVGKPDGEHDPAKGTVKRTGATCLLTKTPMPLEYIRARGKEGQDGCPLDGDCGRRRKGSCLPASLGVP